MKSTVESIKRRIMDEMGPEIIDSYDKDTQELPEDVLDKIKELIEDSTSLLVKKIWLDNGILRWECHG